MPGSLARADDGPDGRTRCSGVCADLDTSPDDEVCSLGTCTLLGPTGPTPCGRACKDTRVDWTSFGTCGERCGTGER